MKKLLLILSLFYTSQAIAQNSRVFSAGLELGIPSTSIYSIGTGVSAKAELPVGSKLSLVLTGGYSTLFYKGNLFASSRTPTAAGFIPLKAGAKYYFSEGVFFEGELGKAIETNYLKQDLFAFALGPGFIIPVSEKRGVEIGLRYKKWSGHQVTQTAIRFAYRIGW